VRVVTLHLHSVY